MTGFDVPSKAYSPSNSWNEWMTVMIVTRKIDARAMGAEGITVDKLEDVGPALKKAIDLQMNHGKTCILEIMCTRELGDPFRRDALSKPVRFLEKYKDYV